MTNLPPAEQLFGRRAEFDPRSRNFQIWPLLQADGLITPRSYTWRCLLRLRQLEGSCVGHTFAHEVAARPKELPASRELAMLFYNWAQQNDEWLSTPPEEGTSGLAGAKACMYYGYLEEYRWAGAGSGNVLRDAALSVAYKGPGCAGTVWRSGMMWPDSAGFIHAVGSIEGAHEYLVRGVKTNWVNKLAPKTWENVSMGSYFRIHNSWSDAEHPWGIDGGDAFITFEEFQELLEDWGDFCIPVKRTAPLV